MPIYRYLCSDCAATFNALVFNREKEPTACIWCEGEIKKIIQPCSFRLEGPGWTPKGNANG